MMVVPTVTSSPAPLNSGSRQLAGPGTAQTSLVQILQPSSDEGIKILWAIWCRDNVHMVCVMNDEDDDGHDIAVCRAGGSILRRLPCANPKGQQVFEDKLWKRIVSPSSDLVLVPCDDGNGSVQLCELPSLDMLMQITYPRPCPDENAVEFGALTWAPDGRHFAILWRGHSRFTEDSEYNPNVVHDLLCIFAAGDGELVGALDLPEDGPASEHLLCTWSATGTQLLLKRTMEDMPLEHEERPHMAQIVNLDGSTQILPVLGDRMHCFACWSGCGNFVLVAYNVYPNAAKLTLRGLIYHSLTAQVVSCWQSGAGCLRDLFRQEPVVTDACSRSFHLPSCNLLIAFPGQHGNFVVSAFACSQLGCCSVSWGQAGIKLHTVLY